MEWLKNMNNAMDYIEANLTENIDLVKVAEIAFCSLSRFQHMFTFVTDITVMEYIRNRRMSVSAKELLDSDIKIVDLSFKYGYESPEAFTRAFQNFHGIPPTRVRKLGFFTSYPKLTFQININGGHFNMETINKGTKPLLRIEEYSNLRVVSFKADCKGPETAAWNLLKEWVVKNIGDYTTRRFFGCAPKGHHPEGKEHQPNEDIGTHEYVVSMFLLNHEANEKTYHGADVFDAPKGLYLVGDVAMNEFNDNGNLDIGTSMQSSGSVMVECLKEIGGYELALNERPFYEEHIFFKEWFTGELSGDGGLVGFKLWLPIKKID